MKVASLTHCRYVVIKCQVRVQSDTEACDGRRQSYGCAGDVDGGDVLAVTNHGNTELDDLDLDGLRAKPFCDSQLSAQRSVVCILSLSSFKNVYVWRQIDLKRDTVKLKLTFETLRKPQSIR